MKQTMFCDIRSRDDARAQKKPVVFIVGDNVSMLETLDRSIRDAGWLVEAFESARRFLARMRPEVPSCLVLEIDLTHLSGLELRKQLVANQFQLPVVFVTSYGDVPMTVRTTKAGTLEFLTKPFSKDVLLSAIESALEHSQNLIDKEVELQTLRVRYASLSRREREVMSLISTGLLNKQVGGELGISEITVKAHRGQIMRKMQAASFADLVMQASRLGLRRWDLSQPL